MDTIKPERGTITGGISIIIIFITLCIAMYGLLAMFVAGNELELNKKNREAAADYYAADAAAAEIIWELASARFGGKEIYETAEINMSYDEATGAVSFTVPVDKFRELNVSVSFPQDGNSIKIERYRVESNLDWQEATEGGIKVVTDFGN